MWCNNTLDNCNGHVQPNLSQIQYPRRSTEHDLGSMPSNIISDNTSKYGEVYRSICRDHFRGSCARGMSCNFLHPGTVEHDGSRFGRNEPQNLGHIEDPKNSRFDGEFKVGDSRLPNLRELRGRSPCRKFRSGKCKRGASCRYLHNEFRKHDRPLSDWMHHHGLGPASMKPGPFEGTVNNFLGTSQEHDGANDAKALGRSPCRNFIGGTCRFGASCRKWHDQSTAHQPGIPVVSDAPNFVNGTHDITLRGPRNRSPRRNFLKGRCCFGATCKNWHDPSAPQQPGIPRTSSMTGFVSGSLGMYSREHQVNQLQNMMTQSFVSKSTPCQFFFQGQGHLHPVTIYGRTRYDIGIQQFQGQGSTIPPGNNHLYEGNLVREVSHHRMHFVNDGAVNDHNRAWPMKEQYSRNSVRMDVMSRSRSLDRQRQSFGSGYGGDNQRPEVCLRFTKGNCDLGESCRYLHSFHEYASSTSCPSKRPCLKASGNLSQEHITGNNALVESSTDKVLVGRDCSFDQEAHVLVGDETHMNCEQCPGVELDQCPGVELDQFPGMEPEQCPGVEPEQCPGVEPEQYPTGSSNSGAGIHNNKIGVCAANTSNPIHPCKNDEKSLTISTMIEAAEGAAVVGVERMESVSRSSSEEHHMPLQDAAAAVVEEDDKGGSMIHLKKGGDEKIEEMMQGVKKRSRKKRKRGPSSTPSFVEPSTDERTGSSSQKSVTGVSDTMNTSVAKVDVMEDDLVNELPVQRQGNRVLTNNVMNKGESMILLVKDGGEITEEMMQGVKKRSRKKRKKGTISIPCSVEPLTEERTCSSSQRSVTGVSDTMDTSAAKVNAVDDDLVIELPVQRQGNRVLTDNFMNKGESMIHLIKDGDEKTEKLEGVKKRSRKKRKRGPSSTPCSVEPSTEERTGSSSQKSVTGVSDTMNTSAAKVNVMEDDLVNELPVQWQGNRVLTNNVMNKGESTIHLVRGKITEEMMQGVKKRSRKKRKRGTISIPCSVEPLTEARTGSSSQRSVTGVSDTMNTSAAKVNVMEDELVNELPVQRQGNRVLTNKVMNNVETSAASTADQNSHTFDGDNNSLASLQCVGSVALSSRRNLLVLDVNGVLADIVAKFPVCFRPNIRVSGKGVFKRPFCDAFLDFCFGNFDVGIWSSRKKNKLTRVVDFLMEKNKDRLLFCWNQSHCTQTGYKTVENKEKPLVLKELKKLWENKDKSLPWERGFYNETNTVLLDDSPYKALCNPPYTAIFPFPYSFRDVNDNSLGRDGALRLYLEKLAGAKNVQTFIQENPFGQMAINKTNRSWGYYSEIIDKIRQRADLLDPEHDKKSV